MSVQENTLIVFPILIQTYRQRRFTQHNKFLTTLVHLQAQNVLQKSFPTHHYATGAEHLTNTTEALYLHILNTDALTEAIACARPEFVLWKLNKYLTDTENP